MAVSIPIVETERLRLRPHSVDDFEIYHMLRSNPQSMRYLSTKPATREETWGRILRQAGHWQQLGFGFWLIEEKATGQIIGEAGLLNLHRQITPSLEGTVESGWMLLPQHQGHGYALEAMTGVFDWASSNIEVTAFSAIIAPENQPSIQLARKLGFTLSATADYNGNPQLLFIKSAAPAVQKRDA